MRKYKWEIGMLAVIIGIKTFKFKGGGSEENLNY